MPFTGPVITAAGLLEITLPTKTIRLCDGAWVDWPSVGRFETSDEDFGTIDSVDAVTESIGDEAIGGTISLLPPSITGTSDLFMPTAQGGPIKGWQAEVDIETNQVVGTPTQLFAVQVDVATIVSSRSTRTLNIDFIDAAEKLWMVKEGNVLSPRWHKSIWVGETGLDAVTGSPVAVPWGITGPGRGSITVGSGGGFGGGSGGDRFSHVQAL
jgi:hypothetical protein